MTPFARSRECCRRVRGARLRNRKRGLSEHVDGSRVGYHMDRGIRVQYQKIHSIQDDNFNRHVSIGAGKNIKIRNVNKYGYKLNIRIKYKIST
jgi:hypothetical protein